MDDAAVLGDLVLTHDMMVAGVHFPPDADPADVAWKLMGVNLSDLAAKGAVPLGVLLGFTLGDADWDRRFVAGLTEVLSHYGTALWGGDTVAAPDATTPRSFGLTAIGRASHLPVPARSGAAPGDSLWVTGLLGAALAGYLGERGELTADAAALTRFRRPEPRLATGQALAPLVTAMMDVSDGLLLDARRMAEASGVTIAIDRAAVPIAACLSDAALRDRALRWGDDYELLFTLPADVTPPCAATRIGVVMPYQPDAPLLIDGAPPPPALQLGWEHGSTP